HSVLHSFPTRRSSDLVIERFQRFHDEASDLAGGDLGLARAFELPNNAGDGALDAVGLDIALPERNVEGAHQLVAVERNLAARLLDRKSTRLNSSHVSI